MSIPFHLAALIHVVVITTFACLVTIAPFWGPSLLLLGHLHPPDRKSRRNKFTVAEFVVLVTGLAFANGLGMAIYRSGIDEQDEGRTPVIALVVILNLVILIAWLSALRFMRRYRINQPKSRLAVLVLIPVGALLMSMLLSTGLTTCYGVAFHLRDYELWTQFRNVTPPRYVDAAAFAMGLISVWLYRRTFARFVSQDEPPPETQRTRGADLHWLHNEL